jgi:hypothetical protein
MDTIEVRHPDGSIDFDFYRARARALRSRALLDAFRPNGLFRFGLMSLAGLAALALVAGSQTDSHEAAPSTVPTAG